LKLLHAGSALEDEVGWGKQLQRSLGSEDVRPVALFQRLVLCAWSISFPLCSVGHGCCADRQCWGEHGSTLGLGGGGGQKPGRSSAQG